MSYVTPQRDGSNAISNFFKKQRTQGDAYRFLGAEGGKREIIPYSNGTTTGDDTTFTLSFKYLVGQNQLMVFVSAATGEWRVIFDQATAQSDPNYNETTSIYFTEDSESTVTVFNLTANTDVAFVIPHTTIPAELREKVLVRDQGSNAAVELLGNGDGILLRSGNGASFLIRVDDSGNLVTEAR